MQALAIGGRGSFFFFSFFFFLNIIIIRLMNTEHDDTPESINWDDSH